MFELCGTAFLTRVMVITLLAEGTHYSINAIEGNVFLTWLGQRCAMLFFVLALFMLTCLLHIYTCKEGALFNFDSHKSMGVQLSKPEPKPGEYAVTDGIERSFHERGRQFSEMCVC